MTEIYIGKDLLNQLVAFAKPLAHSFALITDHHVEVGFAKKVKALFEKEGLKIQTFSFPPGESYKTRQTKEQVEDALFQAGFGKDTCVIAVGGGVVCDVGGFIASTYCRGVSLILVPTTLLSMADGSIGGKNGVDTPFGKNLIGTTYLPEAVFIDILSLESLSGDLLRNGSAEIIKHGLIADPSLFQLLDRDFHKWKARDLNFIEELVRRSCTIKEHIVEQDPLEKGLRRSLNYGHTIGHALEILMNYEISHGEAVAIGMNYASLISMHLGYLKEEEVHQIQELLKKYGFSLTLPPNVSLEKLINFMKTDKKAKGGMPRFVLLKSIGETLPFAGEYCTPVDPKLLTQVLST